jgi:hypothetical protein
MRRSRLVLLVVPAIALAAPAAPAPGASQRAEARRLIKPLRTFERATRPGRAQVRAELAAWQQRTTPCLATRKQDLDAAPNPTSANFGRRAEVIVAYMLTDGLKRTLAPVDAAFASAAYSWQKMRLHDRQLRSLARGEADQLEKQRALPALDTCAFYSQWKAAGFDLAHIPPPAEQILASVGPGGAAYDRALNTLARLVGVRLAAHFDEFPLSPGLVTLDELGAPLLKTPA